MYLYKNNKSTTLYCFSPFNGKIFSNKEAKGENIALA